MRQRRGLQQSRHMRFVKSGNFEFNKQNFGVNFGTNFTHRLVVPCNFRFCGIRGEHQLRMALHAAKLFQQRFILADDRGQLFSRRCCQPALPGIM